MKKGQVNLRDILKDLRQPGYFNRARDRAKRRESPWNLILIPLSFAIMAGCAYGLFQVMWLVHTMIYQEHVGRLREFWQAGISFSSFVSSFLLLMPLLLAAFPLGFLLANAIVWCIPPARKAFDKEANGIKGASFPEAMRGLWVIARILVPACLFLSFIGAVTLQNLK